MATQSVLNYGIRVTSALALMLAVMNSPIRPSRFGTDQSGRDFLRRNFATASVPLTRLSLTSVPSRADRIKAFVSENSEEEFGRATTPPACGPRDLRPTPSLKSPRAFATIGVDFAARPLRC